MIAPRSLVVRLAVVAGVLAGASTALGVVVVEHSATQRLVGELDADLATQQREWQALSAAHPARSAADLERLGRRFLADQHEHPLSQLQMLRIADRPVASNQPDVAARACAAATAAAPDRGTWLVDAPPGISTAYLEGGDAVRVLTLPLSAPGAPEGSTLQVADSMAGVRAARARWEHDALALGLPLSLGVAVLVALAALVLLRPLRSVGEVAGRVGDGDLTARIGDRAGGTRELTGVATVLDDMLDRVQGTIARERRFVADASHEMRTPLAVLRLATERLGRRLPVEHRDDAADLIRRVDGLSHLVDDLLTLAVSDGSPGQLMTRPLRVRDLAADLERDLPLLGERRFVVHACEGELTADPDRLAQVLRNLLANAVRHTEVGGLIEVRITPAAADDLSIEVEDDGAGITPDLLPHVFERFRSEPSARGRRGAAGLGLPICRALVEAHGGTITLSSAPGRGTTASIVLPGYRPA